MPRPAAIGLILLSLAVPAPARAQPLVAESVDGATRLCLYGGLVSARFDDRTNRVVRYRDTETCPARAPSVVTDRPPPPTAMLSSESTELGLRLCVYQQEEEQWRRTVPIGMLCPPAAGMLPQAPPPRRRGRD